MIPLIGGDGHPLGFAPDCYGDDTALMTGDDKMVILVMSIILQLSHSR